MTEQPASSDVENLNDHNSLIGAVQHALDTGRFPRTGIKSPTHQTTEITTTSLKPPQGVWIDDPKFLIDLLSYAEEYLKWIPQYRVKLDQLISQLTPPLVEPKWGDRFRAATDGNTEEEWLTIINPENGHRIYVNQHGAKVTKFSLFINPTKEG